MEILYLILIVVAALLAAVLGAITVYLAVPQPYPSATESDYSHHHSPWWEIYYCHKYLRSKRRAEKKSDLEAHFQKQDFHFDTAHLRETSTLTISAVGDLMCRKELVGRGAEFLYDEIAEELFDSDLAVGNLEFAVNPHTYWYKLLRFSVPGPYAQPLLDAGKKGRFDVVSLANNHINDSFHQGIEETCAYLDSVQTAHTGANPTAADRDRILMVERGGVKIAVLSYTFSTNGLPLEKGREWGTNVIRFNAMSEKDYDPELILRHIASAKEQGADYIISCHHWGIDLEHYPPVRMVRRAHDLLEAGVDLIIGHHPHVLGPVDRYRTRDGRETLCLYSLGNLTAKGLLFTEQRTAAAARISLTVGTDESGRRRVTPSGVAVIPTLFVTKNVGGVRRGIVRRVRRAALEDGRKTVPLSAWERFQLRRAEKTFRIHFNSKSNGLAIR